MKGYISSLGSRTRPDPLAPVQAPPFHGAHPKQKFAYAEADTGERLMLAVAILD